MKDYKSSSHAVWECKYHLAWIPNVPVPGFGRGRRAAGPRALAGDRSQSGDDDLRWGYQSRPRACARIDTAARVGVASRTIYEEKELA